MRFAFCEQAFIKCLSDASKLTELADTAPSCYSAALRGGVLLGVGAFDFLIHEIIRVESVDRARHAILSSPGSEDELQLHAKADQAATLIDNEVRKKHAYKSFVGPRKIRESFSAFSSDIWINYRNVVGKDEKLVQKKLEDIWRWRNRIAHEGDLVPSRTSFNYWPIFAEDVCDAVEFLKEIGLDFLLVSRNLQRS